MEIFKPAPQNLEDLAELLELGVDSSHIQNGIFGRVEYDSTNEVINLYDPYDDLYKICEVTISNNYIMFAPVFNDFASYDYGINGKYKDSSASSYIYRFRVPTNITALPFSAMKCKYGFVFYAAYPDFSMKTNVSSSTSMVIARSTTNESLSEEKPPITIFVNGMATSSYAPIKDHDQQNIYITQHALAGDVDSSLNRSTSAYTLYRIAANTQYDPAIGYNGPGYNLEKTMLTPIPIPGKYGSNDFFETAFFRAMDTYRDNGLHIINGKKYGVFGNWVILDE